MSDRYRCRKVSDASSPDAGNHRGNIVFDEKTWELVRTFNRRYLHRDEVRYRVPDDVSDDIWTMMKCIRTMTSETVTVGDITVTYNIMPEFQRILHRIDRFPTGRDCGPVGDAMILESISTCQTEGACTDTLHAMTMLRNGSPPVTVGERMIENSHRAMGFVRETSNETISVGMIRRLHRIITEDTLPCGKEWEGRFREDDDTVVGNPIYDDRDEYVPPSHERIPHLMESLCAFIDSDDTFIHPVIKGIVIHYMIGHIHPFADGNGRLARAMFYWFMFRKGYGIMESVPISDAIKNSKGRYCLAYQYSETDGNDITYFIRYNLGCLEKAMDSLG